MSGNATHCDNVVQGHMRSGYESDVDRSLAIPTLYDVTIDSDTRPPIRSLWAAVLQVFWGKCASNRFHAMPADSPDASRLPATITPSAILSHNGNNCASRGIICAASQNVAVAAAAFSPIFMGLAGYILLIALITSRLLGHVGPPLPCTRYRCLLLQLWQVRFLSWPSIRTAAALFAASLCLTCATGRSVGLPATLGYQFSCFIVRDNIVCSGYDNDGQIGNALVAVSSRYAEIQPTSIFSDGLFSSSSLSSGLYHSCFIHTGGLQCVGRNSNEKVLGASSISLRSNSVVLGDSTNSAVFVASGYLHSCAIDRNSSLWCLGNNVNGQSAGYTGSATTTPVAVSGVSDVVSVACGMDHTCALLRNGSVFCFGNNQYGQLGVGRAGSAFDSGVVESPEMKNVTMVQCGMSFTCAVDISESVYCWGRNHLGQLGISSTTQQISPSKVPGITAALQVVCGSGSRHTCAIVKPHGALFCWGYNEFGQLGNDKVQNSHLSPVSVAGMTSGVTAVALGGYHTCALAGNQLWCWGSNRYSEIGSLRSVSSVGISTAQRAPAAMPAFSVVSAHFTLPYRSISNFHSCAIVSGRLKCWGYNQRGQLGRVLGSTVQDWTPSLAPHDVEGLDDTVLLVACGEYHSCAIAGSSKFVFCWGDNSNGQLGDNSIVDKASAVRVPGTKSVNASIACAGGEHSCAVFGESGLYCWGANEHGQIGDGNSSTANRLLPTRVIFQIHSTFEVTSVACGLNHVCAIVPGQGLYCWGHNNFGQLGDNGDAQISFSPKPVADIGAASDVSSGEAHTCSLIDSSVFCWGSNSAGQLGVNSTTTLKKPTKLVFDGDLKFSKVACGRHHTCAVSSSGDLFCWGLNDFGQLGVTTDKYFSTVPVKVAGLGSSGVAALSLSLRYTTVVMNDGRVLGWGHMHHSADSGKISASPVPVPVFGVTMSSISLSIANPVVSSISSLSLKFDVGYAGARSAVHRVVASGLAGFSVLNNATAQCLNFAVGPMNVSFDLSSNVQGSSLTFTLPSALSVVNPTDPVQCTLSAVVTPAVSVAALPSVNVTTFDVNGGVIESAALIPHPVVFRGRRASAVSVTLSSYVASASPVTATISFSAEAARTPFKQISIKGLLFAPSASGDLQVATGIHGMSAICKELKGAGDIREVSASATWRFSDDDRTLEISFASDVLAESNNNILCSVAGFTNGIAAPAAVSAVSVMTSFANGTGSMIISGGTFPAIFYAESSSSITVSDTVCKRQLNLTVSIAPVTIAAAVKVISITGLPAFSNSSTSIHIYCSLQQKLVTAHCTLGVSSLSISLSDSTHVQGGSLSCQIQLLAPTHPVDASSSVTISTYVASRTPLEFKAGLSLPAFVSIVVNRIGPNTSPQTGQVAISVFGAAYGASSSQRSRLGLSDVCGTRWISDTSVAALRVSSLSSAASDVPVRVSVQNVEGSITRAFTYSDFLVNVSTRIELPASGGVFFNVIGKGFGSSGSSPAARLRSGNFNVDDAGLLRTSVEASNWFGSSSIVLKMSRSTVEPISVAVSILGKRRLGTPDIEISPPKPTSVASAFNFSTTGSVVAFVSGRNFGGIVDSVSVRFGGTAWSSLGWISDTSVRSRSSSGVVIRNANFIVSAGGMQSFTPALLSYELPRVDSLPSQLLSDISVFGSNFGVFKGSSPLVTMCPGQQLSATSHHTICEFNIHASSLQAGIARAVFAFSFASVSRIDDVTLFADFLRDGSSKATRYILMRNKCSCYPSLTATFEFQVLPVGSPVVPQSGCPASGVFAPEDSAGIINATAEPGKWTLTISAGVSALNLLSASISFLAASLEFKIGASLSSSMLWLSDSSATMNVPGYQNGTSLSRASGGGYGRNLHVTAIIDRLQSRSSAVYSYPDPVLLNVSTIHASLNASSRVPTTGSANAVLSGYAFANVASSPAARLAATSCAGSIWISDTSILCRLSSMRGTASVLALSVAFSAVSSLSLDIGQALPSVLSASVACSASTGGTTVSVLGSSFGNIGNFSVQCRVQRSAAPSTVWASDTAVVFRLPRLTGVSSFIVSVCDSNKTWLGDGGNIFNLSFSPGVTSLFPNITASTGSSMLQVAGIFGTASASMRMLLSSTSGVSTDWISHSSCFCKTSWGTGHQLSPAVSVALVKSQIAGPKVVLGGPWVSNSFAFINASLLNSSTCFFANASVCSHPQIVGLVSNASGFGMFPSIIDVTLEGSQCGDVTWLSDSAVYCAYPHVVSKSLFTLQITVTKYSSNYSVFRTSRISVLNPLFVSKSPFVNTSLFCAFYWPNEEMPSDSAMQQYQRLGRASGENLKPRRAAAAVAEYFEYFSVKVVVYINDTSNSDTQIFLDRNFVPIAKTVLGRFSLYNSSTGTDASAIFCRPQNVTSITLLPEKYAAVATVDMSFCSLSDGVVDLVFNSSSVDENQNVIELPFDSMALTVRAPGPASVSVTWQSMSQFTVGQYSSAALQVLYNAGSALLCSRTRFEFVVALVCTSSEGQRSDDFVFKQPKGGIYVTSNKFRESVMKCNTTLDDFWFVLPSSRCILNVSVPSSGLFAVSEPFVVWPGTGITCKLLGPQVNCDSAGALIWSMKVASGRCLGVQLLDEEGNYASSTASFVAAQARDSNMTAYALLGASNFSIVSDGSVWWCQLYSTHLSQKNVSVGVVVGKHVTWLPGSFGVSSPGPPAVLSVTSVASESSVRLVPGETPPSINFTIADAAGNLVAKISKPFVVRIFVRPRATASASRRLLRSPYMTDSSLCPSVTYVNVSLGGWMSIVPPQLCTAGENDVFYAVGEMIGNDFVPTYSFVLATTVTVLPGPFESFTLDAPSLLLSKSYTLIRDLELVFRDKGMNVVNGNAVLMLRSTNKNFPVQPSSAFNIFSNGTTKAILPPFFLSNPGGYAEHPRSPILVSLVGNVPNSSSDFISVSLTATCYQGSRLNFYSGNSSLEAIYQALLGGHNVSCSSCARPQFNSWLLDAPDCLTLQYTDAPLVLHSGVSLSIHGISVMTDTGNIASYANNWTVVVQLRRAGSSGSAVNAVVMLRGGQSLPITATPSYTDEPASNYSWVLDLVVGQGGSAPVYSFSSPPFVTVLDFSPASLRITPSIISHDGHASITVMGTFPSGVAQQASFSGTRLPSLRSNSCLFKSSSSSRTMMLAASSLNVTNATISFVCGPILSGNSAPPKSSWDVTMLLWDGRQSSVVSIETYCPVGSYLLNASADSPLQCLRCPLFRSSSTRVNSVGLESCVCNSNYYGSFGDDCTACPQNVEGFNCSLLNQARPIIQAGFYIDYSRLSGCSEYSPKCDAIIKCPNPSACPGRTEKDCVKTESECYDNESFGCTSCCPRYYIENFVCKPCPASQLPLVLALCTLALILFAVFSSTFDFPPLVSAAQSLKIFLSSMQGFVSIRLLAISWPPIVLKMLDFTRFFTFNFDVIRPECTVDYTPQTKLMFMLIGPLACSLFIVVLVLIYSVFKCFRISNMLMADGVKLAHNKTFKEIMLSVGQCLFTTSFCLKFSSTRMMVDGALWNALSPALAKRSNTMVLLQKTRRIAVAQNDVAQDSASQTKAIHVPEDWSRMQGIVAQVNAEPEFARSAKRFRLLIASALSIFVFTFQGSIESALSTFDCKKQNDVLFLRSHPNVKCSLDDDMYYSMIVTTFIGVLMYCVVLPAITVITLRSHWCREVYMHDSVAYGQLFGFLTSMYSKACVLWELVACARKVAFVVIPVFVSTESLVQSVSIFVCLLVYTFFVLKMQPMASTTLNQIEILSCLSVIISCFSSIFFVIEYKGNQVLAGASRDIAGLMLVIVCSVCALLSARLMWNEFSRLMLMYNDKFIAKWVSGIKTEMAGMCVENFVIPVIVLFYNDTATSGILESRRNVRLQLDSIEQRSQSLMRLPWYSVSQRLKRFLKSQKDRAMLQISVWRNQLPREAIDKCLCAAEFELLKYLHNLTERIAAWRSFPDKHLPSDQLPKEFVNLKGLSDAPVSAYDRLYRIQETVDAFIPADMQRTMLALMLSELMAQPVQLTHAEKQYNVRLQNILRDFGSRFSDIYAIYRQALDAQRLQTQPNWWKRLWEKLWRRQTTDFARVMSFMTTLDENQVIDIASRALGGTLQAHRKFKEDCNASAPLPLNSISISCDSLPDTELHMNVLSSAMHSPSRNHLENMATQAPALKLDKTAPTERSGLHLADNSKGAQRHLPRSENAKLSQEFPIELQEVVVVGSDFETGIPQSLIHQQRADARCNPADEVTASGSRGAFLGAARGVRANNKIIGALGVERKGKSGAKALVTCIRSQITADGVDVQAGRINQGSSLVPSTAHEAHHSNPYSAAHRSDDGTNSANVPPPPPPPRSRSSCRMRPISGFDATVGTGNDGEDSRSPNTQVSSSASVPLRHHPSTLRPVLPVLQNQDQLSVSRAGLSVTNGRSLFRGDVAHADSGAQPCLVKSSGVEQRTPEPPRSRSRIIAETASQRVPDKDAQRSPAPTEFRSSGVSVSLQSATSISCLAGDGISLSPPLPDAAKEGTRTRVLPAERSSKKHLTKRHASSDGLPPMNQTQQIEEC